MNEFAYVLMLTFCNPTAPYGCQSQLHGTYATAAQCTEEAAKLVEPGTPPMYDEEGKMLSSALCRRADTMEQKDESH